MTTQSDQPSVPETIQLWFLQVPGAVTAILFGTFGVLSWQVADEANDLADNANGLASKANELAKDANKYANDGNLLALVTLCAGGLAGTKVNIQFLYPSFRLGRSRT